MGATTLQTILFVYINGCFWLHPDIRHLALRDFFNSYRIYRPALKLEGVQHYGVKGRNFYAPEEEGVNRKDKIVKRRN
jgi:hypothetical protein